MFFLQTIQKNKKWKHDYPLLRNENMKIIVLSYWFKKKIKKTTFLGSVTNGNKWKRTYRYLFFYIFVLMVYSDWTRYFFIQNMIFLFFLSENKIRKINFISLLYFSLFLPLLAIPHGINNRFSMNFIQTLDYFFTRSIHYLSVFF